MLNNPAARKVAAVIIDPPAKLLVRMKVSPDAVTLTGTIGGSLSMLILIPQGSPRGSLGDQNQEKRTLVLVNS